MTQPVIDAAAFIRTQRTCSKMIALSLIAVGIGSILLAMWALADAGADASAALSRPLGAVLLGVPLYATILVAIGVQSRRFAALGVDGAMHQRLHLAMRRATREARRLARADREAFIIDRIRRAAAGEDEPYGP